MDEASPMPAPHRLASKLRGEAAHLDGTAASASAAVGIPAARQRDLLLKAAAEIDRLLDDNWALGNCPCGRDHSCGVCGGSGTLLVAADEGRC